ncbi:MAG TPA: serine/threonine-protein kinase [Candidatus Limnocylindrales bacterium]|nr:serine/threonine-protein kinase [Candidatus Limnocylindrales bacterium]
MPAPGDLLAGRYRIVAPLGSGGMATVQRARDERLDRDVAVKILLPNHAGDPATAARFEREARSLAAASHPSVVAVFDVDAGDPATGREPFFVMELCPGGSLATRMTGERRLSPDELIPVLVSIADGLADLHRRGVVHRDVKPQNILFAADRAKLADFGVALADDQEGLSELTAPGTAVGTLAYLAPEVLAGERASSAADVYALGVVAFTGLTGELPRPAGSMAELVAAAQAPARRPSDVAPELGTAFDGVIDAALAAVPADRPDALEVATGLTTALGRWSRDGGVERRASAATAAALAASAASASAAAGAGATADLSPSPRPSEDATTAAAVPLGQTARIPIPSSRREAPARSGKPSARLLPGATILAVLLAAVLVMLRFGGLLGGSAAASIRPSAVVASAGPGPSASPSVAASPSRAPSPSRDPALVALDKVDAAILAARGGPDGLKGKEANDLESLAGSVRRALAEGNRGKALDAARKLDKRISDLDDKISRDDAARLKAASGALLATLGG